MLVLFILFTSITALLHIYFFKLESLSFMNAKTLKIFGVKDADASAVKNWAFNQGFYNLFLAFGLLYSIVLIFMGKIELGQGIARFVLLFIVGAGLVLFTSSPKKYRAAMIQAFPALIAIIFSWFF